MDLATLLGLLIGFGSLIGAFLIEATAGEQPTYFYGLVSMTAGMIVYGGTVGALLITFPLEQILGLPKAVMKTILHKEEMDTSAVVDLFVHLAEKARREGLLSLEEEEQNLHDEFLKKGIALVVDGQDTELIRSVLEIDIEIMKKRHEEGIKVLEQAGGYSPTMGVIGTVMGLINTLASLEDPSELGHKVSVAFVATLYGVFTANVIYLPLANKLKRRSEHEVMLREMMLEGILAVQAGDNPRIIKDKLEGYLAPAIRRRRAAAAGTEAARAGA